MYLLFILYISFKNNHIFLRPQTLISSLTICQYFFAKSQFLSDVQYDDKMSGCF